MNVRCRWDISPGALGKTRIKYHSVFFVRRSLVTIVPGQQRNQAPQKSFFLFAMLIKIEVKGEASKTQHLRVSKTPEAHCVRMPKSIQLRVFGGTGEPYIFLDKDAWDRGLVVPAKTGPATGKRWHSMTEGKEPKLTYPLLARGYVAYLSGMKIARLSLDETKQLEKIYIFLLLRHILIVCMFFGNIVIKSSSKQKAFSAHKGINLWITAQKKLSPNPGLERMALMGKLLYAAL